MYVSFEIHIFTKDNVTRKSIVDGSWKLEREREGREGDEAIKENIVSIVSQKYFIDRSRCYNYLYKLKSSEVYKYNFIRQQ
jgi:hypothetical protein